MIKIQKEKIYIDREYDTCLQVYELLDRLGWVHYPENVTGEEIDAGDNSDASAEEIIEVPNKDYPLFVFLSSCGVF